jgi:predicted flap endonuclease-1-like 5' DNA nuclease
MAGFLVPVLYTLGGAVVGGILSWLLRGLQSQRDMQNSSERWQQKFDDVAQQKEQLSAAVGSLKKSVRAHEIVIQKHATANEAARTELNSLNEKSGMLSKNLFTIGAERDELKGQVTRHQNALNIAKQKIAVFQSGINNDQNVYKTQLESAVEERKVLQRKVDDAQSEHQSLSNLLASSRSEYSSVSQLLTSAQSRLKNLNVLEDKIVNLESENLQLEHQATLAIKESESMRREIDELSDLKAQNSQLVRCLESMENSRKQHEDDANRYRSQYEESEKESDTLRFRMGDLQENFAKMRSAEKEAESPVNGGNPVMLTFGLTKPDGEIDDLQQIIGIGKVFEKTLHDLGVYHYRQIAAFGAAEIARINSELKDFTGRIEHDDWIGQAKDLLFKKYG